MFCDVGVMWLSECITTHALCLTCQCISLPHLGFGFPKFSLKPKSPFGGGGSSKAGEGIVLLSNKRLDDGSSGPSYTPSSSSSGITLISKRPLDASTSDLDGELLQRMAMCKTPL